MPDTPRKTITLLDDVAAAGTIRERLLALNHERLALSIDHGAITGAFTLWSSEADNPSLANDDDWTEIDAADLPSPSGSAGSWSDSFSDIGHRWLMLKYVHSSGSGNITARATLKR